MCVKTKRERKKNLWQERVKMPNAPIGHLFFQTRKKKGGETSAGIPLRGGGEDRSEEKTNPFIPLFCKKRSLARGTIREKTRVGGKRKGGGICFVKKGGGVVSLQDLMPKKKRDSDEVDRERGAFWKKVKIIGARGLTVLHFDRPKEGKFQEKKEEKDPLREKKKRKKRGGHDFSKGNELLLPSQGGTKEGGNIT